MKQRHDPDLDTKKRSFGIGDDIQFQHVFQNP